MAQGITGMLRDVGVQVPISLSTDSAAATYRPCGVGKNVCDGSARVKGAAVVGVCCDTSASHKDDEHDPARSLGKGGQEEGKCLLLGERMA